MYSILLVDDEKMELETLAEYIRWDDMGIRVAGTAKNGREALQRLEELQPDMILTDVRMPIMDGLEFSRRAKRTDRNVQIVFLSGHDEFHYIKAALAVEAVGYLLKPLDLEELRQLMDKVKLKCEETRITAQTSEVLKENYLRGLLLEASPEARRPWIDKLTLLPSPVPASGWFQIVYITVDRAGEKSAEDAGFIRRFVRSELPAGLLCQIKAGTFALLICRKPDSPSSDIRDFAERLLRYAGEQTGATVSIGISGAGTSLERLHDLFADAKRANESKFYFGLGACVSADQTVASEHEEVDPEPSIAALCHALTHLQEAAAVGHIRSFFDAMRTRTIDRDLVCSGSLRLITATQLHFANLLGEDSVNARYADEWKRVAGYATMDEIESHVIEVSLTILGLMKEKDKDKNLHIVHQIAELIDRGFGGPLTVEDIAKNVYLSPNYVRTLFKEKTGETILEYLTRVRIRHAAELLKDKSKKIHEIAAAVGYENVSYFCSVFHKFKGTTPNDYRKKLL